MRSILNSIRLFYLFLSVLFGIFSVLTVNGEGELLTNLLLGIGFGASLGLIFLSLEFILKSISFRKFNVITIGLFFGCLMAQSLLNIFSLFQEEGLLASNLWPWIKTPTIFASIYVSLFLAAYASEELHLSIPFVTLQTGKKEKRKFFIDQSLLSDPRILDLANTGILDNQLVLPSFILKEIYNSIETGDEASKTKGRRCLETYKKLQDHPTLNIELDETEFSDTHDIQGKLVKLARSHDGSIITSNQSQIQQSSIEGIKIINVHALSNALKPITQSGEVINIKIQRYGKEARQGIGYLEDGTMVVVNGGAEYIGETIKAYVLSVKHTSSGRMVFCNTCDDLPLREELSHSVEDLEKIQCKNYFAL